MLQHFLRQGRDQRLARERDAVRRLDAGNELIDMQRAAGVFEDGGGQVGLGRMGGAMAFTGAAAFAQRARD